MQQSGFSATTDELDIVLNQVIAHRGHGGELQLALDEIPRRQSLVFEREKPPSQGFR
jgi:hypothetical protein